jgi:diacylglycerol O-acyltransferase / wax synthase
MKPLSPVDAMFFWVERRHHPMHVGALMLFTPPAGAGPGFVRDLVESLRHPPLAVPPFDQRARFRLGHWFWERDDEFDIDYHLRHSALPQPGRIRELLALVSRLHGTLMERSRPLWELHLIEGLADGRVAAYVKTHHALFDGIAAARAMQAVLSEDPREVRPPLWQQTPYRRPHDTALAPPGLVDPLLRAVGAGLEMIPGIRSGLREIFRPPHDSRADAQPFHAPPTMFNVPISGARRFAAQSYSLERLKAIGRATGSTLNDVTLTICAGALRSYLLAQHALPDKPLIAAVPVSVRAADQEGGNQVAMLMANLGTHVADPLERLRLVTESTKLAKERSSQMTRLEQIAHAGAMGMPFGPSVVTGHARKRPMFNLIISNVPGPKKTLYLNGMRLDETYPLSIPFDYLALNITIASYEDQLGFGYTACRRSVPSLQRMLDHTDEALAALEAAVGVNREASRAPGPSARP